MSPRTTPMSDELYEYLLAVSLREPPVLSRLREETAQMEEGQMQIAPEQGQFLRLLTELLGTRLALEIGVFTGYSAISVALAMPEDGRLIGCDPSVPWTDIARRYFREAGVEHKIELRNELGGSALDKILTDGGAGTFDFAFVDADKENYVEYYEKCLLLLRPGGVAAFDNTLWDGRVADPQEQSPSTLGIRALNEQLRGDPRVSLSLVPIGDGLTLIRKRP